MKANIIKFVLLKVFKMEESVITTADGSYNTYYNFGPSFTGERLVTFKGTN